MRPYLYRRGLKELAKDLHGKETIHIGIRPYGFHAGNALALIAYPYLLCKDMEDMGRRPEFRFIVSINTMEQATAVLPSGQGKIPSFHYLSFPKPMMYKPSPV